MFAVPIIVSITLVLVFRLINTRNKPPIFGVYQQRSKYFWFKFVFMYVTLKLRQVISYIKRSRAVEHTYSQDGTVHVHEHDAALEKIHPLGEYPLAVDALYFNGMSNEGAAIICGTARRQENCDAFLYLKINGNELYLSPELPDTYLKQTKEEEGQYRVQGISISNFIPMRTWKVTYSGEMKPKSDLEKRVKVEMVLTWSAHFPVFNYDVDMSSYCLALDIARERWSADYFKLLKKYHQTHYEQMGYISGSVTIDGKQRELNMPCVRDHSFGNIRQWRNFHRYILHFIFLENGDCMQVGVVSQPTILSHLTIGYVCRKSDQAVMPATSCDLQLWQHGENGILPHDYGFVFIAGRQSYHVKIQVDDEDYFYIGKERDGKFYERWARVEVNGLKGWACVENHYNNTRIEK